MSAAAFNLSFRCPSKELWRPSASVVTLAAQAHHRQCQSTSKEGAQSLSALPRWSITLDFHHHAGMAPGKRIPTHSRAIIVRLAKHFKPGRISVFTGLPLRTVQLILRQHRTTGTVATPFPKAKRGPPRKLQDTHIQVLFSQRCEQLPCSLYRAVDYRAPSTVAGLSAG